MAGDVLERIKDRLTPEELKEVGDIVSKSIVALGTDEAFALRDSEGEIRAFKQKVRLSAADGTLAQPVPGGPFAVSAQGYEVLSEATGTCCIFPMHVLVDGQMQQNPYVLRDPHNKRILAIYCRAIAFRFSSKGIPQVADWTTIFDTPSYRLIDLLSKAKKFPAAFRLLPAGESPPKEGGATWAKYPFDESTDLWINTGHEEALQWYAQIINREKKAIDYAQTFARRNATKHLLGIQKAPGPVWDVSVLCWRPTTGSIVKWDATQYVQLQDRVQKVIQGSAGFEEKKKIEMKHGKEFAIDHETGDEDLDRDSTTARDLEDFVEIPQEDIKEVAQAPEPQAPPKVEDAKKEPAKPAPRPAAKPPVKPPAPHQYTDAEKAILTNASMAKKAFFEEYGQALNALGITEPLTPQTAALVNDFINKALDAAYGAAETEGAP